MDIIDHLEKFSSLATSRHIWVFRPGGDGDGAAAGRKCLVQRVDGNGALVIGALRRHRRLGKARTCCKKHFCPRAAQDLVHAQGLHRITITHLATSGEFPLILLMNEWFSVQIG